jgi:cardiolipin synthase
MNLTIPNLISLLRMGLVPWFLIELLEGETGFALAVFALAGITDGLDGFIARFFDQRSVLGAYLDPIADKLLLTTAFVTLAIPGVHPGVLIPLWVTVLVLARDILILVISLVLYLVQEVTRFPPTRLSKLTTVLQISAIALVLLSGLVDGLEAATLINLYLVGALTVFSGLLYIYRTNKLVVEKQNASS